MWTVNDDRRRVITILHVGLLLKCSKNPMQGSKLTFLVTRKLLRVVLI